MFNKIKTIAKYKLTKLAVDHELTQAVKGKEGIVPAKTANGITIMDATGNLQGPDARAFGSVVPVELKGLESTVFITRQLASCEILLKSVLMHEEGHVVLDAVKECGWTMLDAELACDRYMMERISKDECMAFLAMLEIFNPGMLMSGQFEAHEINIARITVLKAHLGM